MRLRPLLLARAVAAAATLRSVAAGARRRAPLAAASVADAPPSISVVIPARDEERRLAPLLDALRGAPDVGEVIVVDDESSDATRDVAVAGGATVVPGSPLPAGWAGKTWALHQGVAAARGEWVVTLDADTRPDPVLPASLVARALADGVDLLSATPRFECPTGALGWLHPAMLTTLVYRFGPPDVRDRVRVGRLLSNGQCTAFRRERLLSAGGFAPVAGSTIEDVALARHLASSGWSVASVDASSLLTTRMYEDLRDGWTGWSRSLALPGVEPGAVQAARLAQLVLAQALPLVRVLARRADALDAALLALRVGTLAATATAYSSRRPSYWLSPTADVVAVAAVARSALLRRSRWRGRTYRA